MRRIEGKRLRIHVSCVGVEGKYHSRKHETMHACKDTGAFSPSEMHVEMCVISLSPTFPRAT